MNLGKHLEINIDEVFITYQILDSNQREWVHGKERRSLDQEQCIQQVTQLIKHKHEHYTLTDVKINYINVHMDEAAVREILQKQISIPIK